LYAEIAPLTLSPKRPKTVNEEERIAMSILFQKYLATQVG
jgi:hypothetical protein